MYVDIEFSEKMQLGLKDVGIAVGTQIRHCIVWVLHRYCSKPTSNLLILIAVINIYLLHDVVESIIDTLNYSHNM